MKIINKDTLQQIITNSTNKKQCLEKLKFHMNSNSSYRTLNYYIRLYDLNIDHFNSYGEGLRPLNARIPLDEIFEGKHPLLGSSKIREKLLREGIFVYECSRCKLKEWNSLPIPLELDHINGINTDHRIDNLRLLCRNCHGQTNNFCGKNTKHYRDNNTGRMEKIINHTKMIENRVKLISESNIDFSTYGWITKVSELLNISPQKVTPWMKRHMTQFYHNNCYRRQMAGTVGFEPT